MKSASRFQYSNLIGCVHANYDVIVNILGVRYLENRRTRFRATEPLICLMGRKLKPRGVLSYMKKLTWSQLCPEAITGAPMRKFDCGLATIIVHENIYIASDRWVWVSY